jgi:hypothetical protein
MRMRDPFKPGLLLAAVSLLLIVPRYAEPTVLQFLEMEELTEISEAVVLGKVVAVESEWNESHNGIRTQVTLEVQRVLQGSLENEKLNVELPGGFMEGERVRQVIPGIPRFAVGEEAVVFLRKEEGLLCPIAGWIQGKFEVVAEPPTGRKLVVDRFGHVRRYLERKGNLGKLRTIAATNALALDDFASLIAEIQGRKVSGK